MTDRVTSVKPEPHDYPLTKAADGIWQAQIVVTNSAEYVIKLTNNYGLTNKDDQPHLITVRFDEKPTITIVSPQSGDYGSARRRGPGRRSWPPTTSASPRSTPSCRWTALGTQDRCR